MNIQRKTIERVVITGPTSERQKAFAYAEKGGYAVVSSGPRRLEHGYRIDPDHFKLVLERQTGKD